MGDLPPPPREYTVPHWDEVPSRGFLSPHERLRFEYIAEMTDERTAIKLYSYAYEELGTNLEDAIRKAVGSIRRDPEEHRWRYICSCGFIGAAHRTFTEAEYGALQHEQTNDMDCNAGVFAYDPDDWNPDDAEELAQQYWEAIDDDQ